ncbi:hypothetical protein IT418_00155 [bacterium]|nr:hypothetical protein [bacterium]
MELHILFGPTATSKTKMAQTLWEKYRYPILSVDSRKVYKGADIGTNKLEILAFQRSHPEVLFGGVDFLEPNQEVSVYIYQQYVYNWVAQNCEEIKNAGGLILHGGTGLYLDAILEGRSLLSKRNDTLRNALLGLSIENLQKKAKKINPVGFERLNNSDAKNPRRLIRVIENEKNENIGINTVESNLFKNATKIWHDSRPGRKALYEKINERVHRYFSEGWFKEVLWLLGTYGKDTPALKMMGYKQIVNFMMENATWEQLIADDMPQYETLIATIQREHRRYAKRQETWGRKYFGA